MPDAITRTRKPALPLAAALATMTAVIVVAAVSFASSAQAAGPPDVLLRTSAQFAVLASDGVSKTGPITVTGLVGSAPTGINGTGVITPAGSERGVADGQVATAKADLLVAYGQAAGAKTPTTNLTGQIGNRTITGGTYNQAGSLDFTGQLTLDGENDPDSVFLIQVGADFTTATGASVVLTRGAQACHVYWQIGNDAVIETDTAFQGNILAGNDISARTDATFVGRLLTNTGAVTLDSNTITLPVCSSAIPTIPGPVAATPNKTPKPKPAKTSTAPSSGSDSSDSSDSEDSDDSGSSDDSETDTETGGGTTAAGGGGAGTGTGTSTTATPGLPDTGGPPWFLAPLGGVVVLAGLGVVIAARTPRGMHRA